MAGENLRHDHYGRARPASDVKRLLASERITRKSLRTDAGQGADVWSDVLRSASVICPFDAAGPDGKPVPKLELLSAAKRDGSALVFLANATHRPVHVTVRCPRLGSPQFRDLITGATVDLGRIEMATDQVLLLQGR